MLFQKSTGRMETDGANNGSWATGRRPIVYAVGVIETLGFCKAWLSNDLPLAADPPGMLVSKKPNEHHHWINLEIKQNLVSFGQRKHNDETKDSEFTFKVPYNGSIVHLKTL